MGSQVPVREGEKEMTPNKRTLIRWYLVAVLVVVIFVPWTDPRYHTLFWGYRLVFFPPLEVAVIDYGKVLLELIAVTCIAGLVWLIQDKMATGKEKTPDDS